MTETETPQTIKLHSLLRVAGIALTAASLGYVLYELFRADWSGLHGLSAGHVLLMSAAGSALYCGLGLLLCLAWWHLLRRLSSQDSPVRATIQVYAVTQIYKYLPTNVLHFMGRHAALRQAGHSHLVLASAMVLEALSLAVAAAIVALMFGADALIEAGARYVSAGSVLPWLLLGGAALVALCVAYFVLARRQIVKLPDIQLSSVASGLLWTSIAHIGFFVGCGLILVWLAHGLTDLGSADNDLLIAVAATSWLLGFVVPGAAAGIGIREAVIILLLSQPMGSAAAIALAGLYRIVTVGGDALLAVVGLVWRSNSPS